MSESISPELNYSPVVNNHSTVIFRKVTPQGASTVALSTSSSVGPTEIIIAPSVFNPSKSRLNFQLQLPAPATTVNAAWINANALSALSRVVVYDSASNSVLLDASNFEKYAALVVPASTSFREFSTKAATNVGTGVLASTSANSQLNPFEDIGKCNSLVNVTSDNTALASTSGTNAYMGRKQNFVGADITAVFVDFSIPFSAFKHTFLSVNKNVYSPSNLVLQLYWNSLDNFVWNAKSITDPTTTVTSAASGNINNIALQLANEGNLAIVSQVINKVMTSGITLPFAYPTVTRQAISASSAHSYQLQLTKGYGQRILAVISAHFNTAATINLRNEHERDTLTTYNTFLNNVALKYPNGFNCLAGEDYYYGNREYMEDSAIQTIGEYIKAEWFHCDSFFGEKPLHSLDQTQIDGLDVGTQSSTWSIQANLSTSTAYTWITAIIGQKVASFTSSGVIVQ
jgi:hypothetical protein